MKRHTTASAVNLEVRSSRASGGAGTRTRAGRATGTRGQPGSRRPRLRLAGTPGRIHTLVLTGQLDHASAHALEAEIERLCDERVHGITLDLRELEAIDPTGVAVIAFRSGLCKRRGYDFAVIPGPVQVQRAFEQAGIAEKLPFSGEEVRAHSLPA